MTTNNEGLLDERAAAKLLGVSRARMKTWRCYGGGPKFHKLGVLVRYSPDAIAAFLRETEREPAAPSPRSPKPTNPRRRKAASDTPSATPAPAQAAA